MSLVDMMQGRVLFFCATTVSAMLELVLTDAGSCGDASSGHGRCGAWCTDSKQVAGACEGN